jgi:phosphoglycerate dehydrogenase-like enzyme
MIIRVVGDIDVRRLDIVKTGAPADVVYYQAEADAPPDVLFVWAQRRSELTHILAQHGDHLRWVHFRRVGIGEPIVSLFRPFPHIQLTNGSGASGIAVAEHALALLLALLKRLPELRDLQREHTWSHGISVAELYGRTACVVGLGDVGRSAARLLRAFGVHVLGVRRTAEQVAEVDETYPVEALHTVLERSSILVLAPALTPATRRLIGATELARLPAGALVINVGRGAVLDEAALIAALQSSHLAGAGLDVLADEPLAAESPLWDMPNVIITPHSAAHTEATDDRSVELFVDNLERVRRGDEPRNRMH